MWRQQYYFAQSILMNRRECLYSTQAEKENFDHYCSMKIALILMTDHLFAKVYQFVSKRLSQHNYM